MVTAVKILLALLTSLLPESNNQNLVDVRQEQLHICGGSLRCQKSDTLLLQASCCHVCVAGNACQGIQNYNAISIVI